MTTPDFEAMARRLVAESDGGSACTCDIDYSARNKRDPQCRWHQFGEDAVEAFAAALKRVHEDALKQGYGEGIKAAAQLQGAADNVRDSIAALARATPLISVEDALNTRTGIKAGEFPQTIPDQVQPKMPSKSQCLKAAEEFVKADHCKAAFYKGARWLQSRLKGEV